MARTQAADFNSKRAAITSQAGRLFAQQGFNGTSIADLSKACNVSKSLIYHYYAAKEDILFEVMSNHIDTLVSVVESVPPLNEDPIKRFTELTKAILACYAGAEDQQKVLLYELGNLPMDQRKDIISKQRSIIATFEASYSAIFPKLMNNAPLLRSKIMLFFGMINWTHTWYNSGGAISRDELAELAASIMTSAGITA